MNTAIIITLIICGTILAIFTITAILSAIMASKTRKTFKDFNDKFKF